jgi:hypothetical protein
LFSLLFFFRSFGFVSDTGWVFSTGHDVTFLSKLLSFMEANAAESLTKMQVSPGRLPSRRH